jgi:hypothetical protein
LIIILRDIELNRSGSATGWEDSTPQGAQKIQQNKILRTKLSDKTFILISTIANAGYNEELLCALLNLATDFSASNLVELWRVKTHYQSNLHSVLASQRKSQNRLSLNSASSASSASSAATQGAQLTPFDRKKEEVFSILLNDSINGKDTLLYECLECVTSIPLSTEGQITHIKELLSLPPEQVGLKLELGLGFNYAHSCTCA